MNDDLNFEVLEVEGRDALRTFHDLREEFPETGAYPFIIGSKIDFERVRENASFQKTTTPEILEKAYQIDVPQWFEKQRKSLDETRKFDAEFAIENLIGKWNQPENSPLDLCIYYSDRISAHKDVLTKKAFPRVFLGRAKIREAWMLPAFVEFGDYNDCPAPAAHCAVMRHWQTKYGAEIVSMTADVIECRVGKPPRDEKSAVNLAWEQYLYCSDIVEQGVDTIAALAASLYDSDYWFFWWD